MDGIYKRISSVEKHYKTQEISYDGVKIWPMIRTQIFLEYLIKENRNGHSGEVKAPKSKLRRIWLTILI